MNPFQLTGSTPDGRQAHVWACGCCMRTCVSEDHAKQCCTCSYCGHPLGEERKHNRTSHDACRSAAWQREAQERVEKAEKLDSWDGGVFFGDRYYSSLDEAVEAIDEDFQPDERPEYLFVAKPARVRKLDAEEIMQNYLDDVDPEDDGIVLKGQEDLAAACKAFNEANADLEWYKEDCKRMVRVPPRSDE